MAEVRLEIDAEHPPERVWRALTDARLLGEWFMATDLEPREGCRFTLDPGTLAGFLGLVEGELTEIVPPRRLVMLWQGEKLHTRVAWELTETAGGCRIAVVQSGFIGAPATLRRRALRDTYTRLFAQQLPAVLDRLARGEVARGEVDQAESSAESLRAAVPRPRRATNAAVGAWSAGRTLGPAPDVEPVSEGTMVQPPPPPGSAGTARAVEVPRQRTAGSGEPEMAPEPIRPVDEAETTGSDLNAAESAGEPTGRLARWQERLALAPGWLRAIAIGAAAAVFAVVVLAATVHTPGQDDGPGAEPGAEDQEPDGPGVAIQPGAVTSETGTAGSPGAAEPPGGQASPGATGPPATAGPEGSGGPLGQSDPDEDPPPSGAPEPPPPPTLTADVSTSGLPLVGGRAVTVTVSNPGPGTAPDWEVVMDVGDQNVSDVEGATYQQDGSQAIFTSDELAEGASAQFSFSVGGLLGASDPSGCTIDGEPCG